MKLKKIITFILSLILGSILFLVISFFSSFFSLLLPVFLIAYIFLLISILREYSRKKITIICFLFIFYILIMISVILTGEVLVLTDRAEYETGEKIEITIENKTLRPIYRRFNSSFIITKLEGEEWKNIPHRCYNPSSCEDPQRGLLHYSLVPPRPFYVKIKSPLIYSWDQTFCLYEEKKCGEETYKEGIMKELNQGGQFKVRFCYWHQKDVILDKIPKKCVEKEFRIKPFED